MANTQNIDFKKFIPLELQNEGNLSLAANLFNRFVSEEKSVFINGRIGRQVDGDPSIQASSLDRELNALIPALYFKTGSEENVFAFDDFLNKLDVLNVQVENMRSWMAEQSYNFSPPISYDKFINYSNYFWIGRQLAARPTLGWNPDVDPEFYVIEKPINTDPNKLPAALATTGSINLYANNRPPETFTITFLSNTTFTVTSNQGLVTSSVSTISPILNEETAVELFGPGPLCSFIITTGPTAFSSGDTFTLQIKYFTSEIYISLTSPNLIGKGSISAVATTSPVMTIDGISIKGGDRVLVKNQTDPSENGIYLVLIGQKWIRASDATKESYLPVGSRIFVEQGVSQTGYTYELTGKVSLGPLPDDTINSDLTFTFLSSSLPKGVNEWQEYNYWVHRDDFGELAASGILIDGAVQANRPIIEYRSTLQLNSDVTIDGIPTDETPGALPQVKTRFNQVPQFDLYRYDGTHHGATSGIFFYVEDPDFTTDDVLKKRVKLTPDYDYVFGTGLADSAGRLLYYKDASVLTGIWRQGVTSGTTSAITFTGGADRGTLMIDTIATIPDNQDWKITALTPTTFSVVGTRSGNVGVASIGVQFITDDLSFTISNGINPFIADESFTFQVYSPLAPRYVKKLTDGSVVNYPGWAAGDALDAVIDGTWLNPLRMFQNLERETRAEISFADFLNHARSVARNQDGFTGTSFGNNNLRNIPFNPGLGGTIREFGSNFPLLASMLIERDVSPLTIIDFAEQQYLVALSSIDQFLVNELANYIGTTASITTTTINASAPDIIALENAFETLRAQDENLRVVFGDTTMKVKNWPATLPAIGMLTKVSPTISFDHELGIDIILHHDGHVSPLAVRDADFDRKLVRTVVPRSDGTSSAGIFSETTPSLPYARQFWLKPSTFALSIFDVIDDSNTPRDGISGEFWYNRSSNQLYEWDVLSSTWVLSVDPVSSRWKPFDSSAVRNSLVLCVEQKLYDSVHPAQQLNIDLSLADDLVLAQIELARYSAKYNYDTYASVYNATDAFSWNYKQATIPGMVPVPARWFEIYKKNFDNPGFTLPTDRPNIEPWKLLNYATKPGSWDATYAASNPGSNNFVAPVKVVAISPVAILFGLQIVDGVMLSNGDRILLTAQTLSEFNGLYTVSSGGWSRTPDVLVNQITIPVAGGFDWVGSVWSLTSIGPFTIGTDPLIFEQVRTWKAQMWVDIKTANPTLKLCVNVNTDVLIPPYVSPSKFESAEALLTIIPVGAADGYSFGDMGPIELVWTKSLEYSYGLARSYFRMYPLYFLDKTWGETYVKTGDNLRVERNLVRSLPSAKFLMHGERLNIVNEYTPAEIQQRVVVQSSGSITWTGAGTVVFEVTHVADNVTVFYVYVNGVLLGLVYEGVVFDLPPTDGIDFTDVKIDDLGIPFELGDKITMTFYDDIVDPNYVPPVIPALELGCEGCVADGTPIIADPVPMVQVQPVYVHTPATVKKFKGTGQWFTDLLRFSYIDTSSSQAAQAYRAWELKLVHRVGALIRSDTLTINTAQGRVDTPGFSVILKRSANVDSKWISGLRVQLLQMGSRKLNQQGSYVPTNDASDWVFRVEVYNAQHPLIEYYTLNTSSEFVTFNALAKQRTDLAWKRYTEHVALVETTMPLTITGLQNVVNLCYGYVDRLEEIGWTVATDQPTTDAETGRNLDWQLEIEKLIDRVYGGLSAGTGHILNPFMEKAVLSTPVGLMSRYNETNFIDAYSMQAAFDVNGTVIPVSKLMVVRTDERAITYSLTPIFSVHAFTDEFEHAIVFNKKFSGEDTSAVIFDPFLGARIDSALLSYIRQDAMDRKPTFDGFFLNGNDVRRNFVSSIDNMGNFYDAAQTFGEPTTATHALALLGFTKKDYFGDIGINDPTQFNFWRGLVQAKGTNMTIDAFVNYKKFADASVDEYWAYRLAEFGDARERTFPEIKINTGDVTQRFARLQFYSKDDPLYSALPLFTQVENGDDTRWFSIDDLGKGLRFEAQKIVETVIVPGTATFPAYIRLNHIFHNGDAKAPLITGPAGASMIGANLMKTVAAGTYTVSGYTWLNPTKLSPIKLFDYQNKDLVDEIGLWHPAIGIHAYAPLELVNMIGKNDPAQYSSTTQTTNNVNYRHLKPWAEREVGRVWWDTSNLGYVPYYDASIFPNRDTRDSRWGALAEWASIDLYEWTQSNVHPSEYDDLASAQEGDSEIDRSVRLSGKTAFKRYYQRNRSITMRPIAWSKAGVGNANAHPAFGPAEFTKVYASGNLIVADVGRTLDVGLVAGRNFGGWRDGKPYGEVSIDGDIVFDIGSSAVLSNPVLIPLPVASGNISSMRVEAIDNGVFGTRIGSLALKKKNNGGDEYSLRMIDSTNFSEDIDISRWFSDDLTADDELVFDFELFGLRLIITRDTTGVFEPEDLVDAITNPLNDIFIREAVRFTTIIPLQDVVFINDDTDPDYATTEFEWRTWEIPTQEALDADLISPRNTWLPYPGDEVAVEATSGIVAAMSADSAELTLRSGVTMKRFTSTWTDWVALASLKVETISNGSTPIEFTLADTIDGNRLSIYANGIQMNPASYVITGDLVQVVNIQSEGTTVLLLYRAYQPTEAELAFNPDVEDDFTIQIQYKLDYQFTKNDVRDEEGNIIAARYFFWVQDKTIPHIDKSMSLVQAKSILKSGPSTYTIFARAVDAPTPLDAAGVAYDSCSIAGLNSIVTKNDSYKLRFLRNFTLRDDPEELRLKNVHTEWTLIRKTQSAKIPKSLWDVLTDAVSGEDAGGNALPSQVRIDYDARNNTRTRYGFRAGQIFAETALVRASIVNAILNTELVIKIGTKTIPDYITALDLDKDEQWFADATLARATMTLIWNTARPRQINEIFFSVLDDALSNNYEFSDLFKTSYITVASTTSVEGTNQQEQVDEIY